MKDKMFRLNFRRFIVAGGVKCLPAIVVVILILFSCNFECYGMTSFDTNYFNVNMKVLEDKSVLVTEKIVIDAHYPQHGIYRYIPLVGTSYIEEAGKSERIRHKVKISDISVSENIYTYTENDYYVLQIGDGNTTFTGTKEYTISYKYTIYDDSLTEKDIFYCNVLPHGWETPIQEANITIEMPKSFNERDAHLYLGDMYETYEDVSFEINNNLLSAKFKNLRIGEGVTLLINLPEGYFVNVPNNNWLISAGYVTILASMLLVILIFFIFGRDKKIVRTVEFYPPKDMSPAEMGYVIDGIVDKKDMVSMIIYFAEKGWLEINEVQEKQTGLKAIVGKSKSRIYLKKLCSPNSEKSFEITLFDGLFKNQEEVSIDSLSQDFYEYYQTAKEQLVDSYKQEENRLFTKSSIAARLVGLLSIGIPFTATIIFPAKYEVSTGFEILGIICYILLFIVAISSINTIDRKLSLKKSAMAISLAGSILLFAVCSIMVLYSVIALKTNIIMFILALISTAIIFIATVFMLKRTDKRNDELGKILGFREFIRVAERDRIEKLSLENPSYFYDVLPYAYIFGMSDKWAKKFENINITPPMWYNGAYGDSMFSTYVFLNAFNYCTHTLNNNINIPSTISTNHGGIPGGFGGGGGFSGGGFGGGGGGGW